MISPVRNQRRRAARLMTTLVLVLVASSLLAPDVVRSWPTLNRQVGGVFSLEHGPNPQAG